MRTFDDLTYYEILEVSINASGTQIRQAYKDALSIYGTDSPLSYAFFTESEAEELLNKIETAFAVLIDQKSRKEYNQTLIQQGKIRESDIKEKEPKTPIPLFQPRPVARKPLRTPPSRRAENEHRESIVRNVTLGESITGPQLKEIRSQANIALEDVFEATRISTKILRAIEEENFAALPSTLYLKSFLQSYARFFQMNPEKVSEGYLRHMKANWSP